MKRIVSLVKKFGDKRKTFFVFTSDNGLELGAHRIMFKNYLYEEGEHVPLIIRGPGFPAGVTRDAAGRQHRPRPDDRGAHRGVRPGGSWTASHLLPLAQDPHEGR